MLTRDNLVDVCRILIAVALLFCLLYALHDCPLVGTQVMEVGRGMYVEAEVAASEQGTIVHFRGMIKSSVMVVSTITRTVKNGVMVIIVRGGFVRGSSPKFDVTFPLPEGVKEIRFGKRQAVIWKRPDVGKDQNRK